jgi:two-component sensor histidine kinase
MNISEIIANAYEHAFEGRQEGKITIEISQEGDTIGITVMDNGIGLPDEFEEMRKDSLGITLIKTLCKQLQSEIEIESGDWGTRFSFAFQKRAVSGSSSLKKV